MSYQEIHKDLTKFAEQIDWLRAQLENLKDKVELKCFDEFSGRIKKGKDSNVKPALDNNLALEQKIKSFTTIQSFWYECLSDGINNRSEGGWSEEIPKDQIYKSYLQYCEATKVRYIQSQQSFLMELYKYLPPNVDRSHDTKISIPGRGRKTAIKNLNLEACRDNFNSLNNFTFFE